MTVKVHMRKGTFVSEVYAIDTEQHEVLVWNSLAECFSWIPTCDLVSYTSEGKPIIMRHMELVK